MKLINAFSRALVLCGGLVFASTALHAETITQSSGVTVVRGADDAAAAQQRGSTRGRGGVAVFRGESTPLPQPAAPAPGPAQATVSQVVGGQNLWVHDAGTNTITACNLRYDAYGNQQVRCHSSQP